MSFFENCKTPDSSYCQSCPNIKECYAERGKEYRCYTDKNVVINIYPDSDYIELLYYKDKFLHLIDSENLPAIDRSRMLEKNLQGEYVPISDDFTIQALQKSITNSSKRAKDSFFGYAKSNDWEYFITLTFSPDKVNRYDDLAVKELWSDFQRWCKRKSPDCKILIVPERHKDGALHFHGLMSNIALNLAPAINKKTGKPLYCAFGTPLLTITDWTFGFSTLAVIPKESNYERVVNYISKYISKSENIGYNQKRYFHTRNLNFKNKAILFYDKDELDVLVAELGLVPVKENDKMVVYRKNNNEKR